MAVINLNAAVVHCVQVWVSGEHESLPQKVAGGDGAHPGLGTEQGRH